jgi:predicted nicotinamide N-methyase
VRRWIPSTQQWEVVAAAPAADPAAAPLPIEWRQFDIGHNFTVNNIPIVISEIEEGSSRPNEQQQSRDTGRHIWDGSVVLARYIEEHMELVEGKSVLELGAGCGVAGLAAGACGARHVTITDLPYCITNIQRNIDATKQQLLEGVFTARAFDWDSPPCDLFDIDVVIAADVIWLADLVPLFVKACKSLKQFNNGVQFIIAHQTRAESTDALFFSGFERELNLIPWVRAEVGKIKVYHFD